MLGDRRRMMNSNNKCIWLDSSNGLKSDYPSITIPLNFNIDISTFKLSCVYSHWGENEELTQLLIQQAEGVPYFFFQFYSDTYLCRQEWGCRSGGWGSYYYETGAYRKYSSSNVDEILYDSLDFNTGSIHAPEYYGGVGFDRGSQSTYNTAKNYYSGKRVQNFCFQIGRSASDTDIRYNKTQYYYGIKLENGGIVYLNLVPRKINGLYGFYDTVSGIFYDHVGPTGKEMYFHGNF